MTRTILILLIAVAAFAAGFYVRPMTARHDHESAAVDPAKPKQLWTCSMHPQVIQDHPGNCPICHMELTPLKSSHDAAGVVTIDPVVVQNMGIRTEVVTEGPITQAVRAVGYLNEPEPTHRDINLRVSGWIEKLYANIDGMDITENQPLFDLYSPELMVAIDELIAAHRQITTSPDDRTAQTLFDSSRQKLTQYGLTEKQIASFVTLTKAPATIPILAPITGHLTAKMVYDGSAVKAGDLVMRLANRHEMWIDAQVFERDYPLVTLGAAASISVAVHPGKTYTGKVIFIHPHIDAQTRTAMVRIEIPNHDMSLRQGMYAKVEIASDDRQPLKLIPREAVIDTGVRQIAFVATGEGRFEMRPLKLGLAGSERVQVLDGLELGERVVTSGQFLLDTESRLRESIAKQNGQALLVADEKASSTPTTAPASQATHIEVPHADEIVAAYLSIQKRLGEKQKEEMPVDLAPLIASSRMSAQHAPDAGKPFANAVLAAAEAMKDQPLAKQRELFMALSDAMIDLAKSAQLSVKMAGKLYVAKCPMAFGDRGARWLQSSETIANPYYATEMKSCGEIESVIEPAE